MPMRLTVIAGKSGCASSPLESMRSSSHRSWPWIPALAATTSILPYFSKVDLNNFDMDVHEEISVSTKLAFLTVSKRELRAILIPLDFFLRCSAAYGIHVSEYDFRARIDED